MSEDIGKIHPVILCGGSGTRLWPVSRKERPKPFQRLLGDRTLFQQTIERVSDKKIFARPVIVGGTAHSALIEEQLADAGASVLVEPMAKNTAPAIAAAAHRLPSEAIMLVCPSDHAIADRQSFLKGVMEGAELARDGKLVAIGIAPTRPETGYGYIEIGKPTGPGHDVARFVEKPDAERAEQFLRSGRFVWNGGIFLFRAGDLLEELRQYRPDMAGAVAEAVQSGKVDSANRFRPNPTKFDRIAAESIDYAVMENTGRAAVVSADMGWSDIGDWSALFTARREAGLNGGAQLDTLNADNVSAMSDGPNISVVGLSDIVVVVNGDEVLVSSKTASQMVGDLPGVSKR